MNNKKDLGVSRIIKAPRSAIWSAWKDPVHLAQWWAPSPVRTTVNKLELRAGGAFDTVMRLEDGTEFGGEACFLEVVENERIVWTSALQGGWRPNKDEIPSLLWSNIPRVRSTQQPLCTRMTKTARNMPTWGSWMAGAGA